MYDLAIVGAGPSGATLARLMGHNYKILLIDKRELLEQKGRASEKCCGGLIAPDAQYMLSQLGLGVPKKVLVGPQLFVVRTIDIQNKSERNYQRHYINIDRELFDSWLVSLISSSVDIRCGCLFKSYEKTAGGVRLKLNHRGKEYVEEARFLIGADGAFSKVRRQLAPQAFPQKYFAIQEWYEVEKILPYFSAIFDNDITDYYSWTIPKEEFLLVGSAIPVQFNTRRKFELLKERLSRYGFILGKVIKKQGCYIIRPQKVSNICLGKDNILLIGEAAGWISPTSAEGLSYCFRSALALAKSLGKEPGECLLNYARMTKALKINIFGKKLKAPFMYHPFIRKMVMSSGISSMKIASPQGDYEDNCNKGK